MRLSGSILLQLPIFTIKTLSRYHSHITSAITFLATVKKDEPLVFQLKRFFAANKKYGSKDRKNISSLCYGYYRIGNAMPNKTAEEKIIASLFLCNNKPNETLAALAPQLNDKITEDINTKCKIVSVDIKNIFAFTNQLSNEIDKTKFAASFLKQPLLFIRPRLNKETQVAAKLKAENIAFEEINKTCFALPTATKIEEYFTLNKDLVIQDKNSQQVFNYLQEKNINFATEPQVWDCCAASGGKSILLYDILKGKLQLNVSDMRSSILNNLRIRFAAAGIKKYNAFVADILDAKTILPKNKYDIIICDAPCTGSGTWARTPEQHSFFTEKSIGDYSSKQQKIATAVLPFLKKEGLFFYITCSAFKKENEDVVTFLAEKFKLKILQQQYLKGYETQADTMFVAVMAF